MKKIALLLISVSILTIPAVNAQMLTTHNSASAPVAVAKPSAPTVAATAQTTSASAVDETLNEDAKAAEDTGEVIIPAKLSQEEIDIADDNLRENLRDTNQNDDIKTRAKFINVNHDIDKTLTRRELQKRGLDFKTSAEITEKLSKPKVNLKSDKQMNDYIFDRADVTEKKEIAPVTTTDEQ